MNSLTTSPRWGTPPTEENLFSPGGGEGRYGEGVCRGLRTLGEPPSSCSYRRNPLPQGAEFAEFGGIRTNYGSYFQPRDKKTQSISNSKARCSFWTLIFFQKKQKKVITLFFQML